MLKLSSSSCVGCECLVALCILFLVASGVDVSCCALGVDFSTGGAFFGLGANVARSIEITCGIPSSSIVILCEIM